MHNNDDVTYNRDECFWLLDLCEFFIAKKLCAFTSLYVEAYITRKFYQNLTDCVSD